MTLARSTFYMAVESWDKTKAKELGCVTEKMIENEMDKMICERRERVVSGHRFAEGFGIGDKFVAIGPKMVEEKGGGKGAE